MGLTKFPNQIHFTGRGYLDTKFKILKDLDELNSISRTNRFKGYTVIVLNDGTEFSPCEYWIPDDNLEFVKKYSPENFEILLDEDFKKLQLNYNHSLISEIDIDSLFKDNFLNGVELAYSDNNGNKGVFLKFSYTGDKEHSRVDYIKLSDALSEIFSIDSSLKYDSKDKKYGVNISSVDGNILKNTENGLMAGVSMYIEDEEINKTKK